MTDTSSTVSVAELRAGLSDAISRATFGHERIGITRRGKVAAALIGPADLARLGWLDDNEHLAALHHARKEDDGERISLDEVLAANGITRCADTPSALPAARSKS